MPAGTVYLPLVGAEGAADEVGILDSYIQEGLLASGAVMGHGTLYQVTTVVEFMRVDLLPLMGAPPTAQTGAVVGDAGSQVTVRLLCLGNEVNDGVEIVVQLAVVLCGQGIRSALDDLIGVSIVKREVALVLTFDKTGSQGEIVEAPALLTLPEGGGYRHRAIHFDAGSPEPIIQMYLREGHLSDRGCLFGSCRHL